MNNFKKICASLNNLLKFDVELMYGCGEPYLCVFHEKTRNDDYALYEISQVAHMVKSLVDKYYSNVCVLGNASINAGDNIPVSCTFKMSKPMLDKEELKSQYGIDCRWENEWDCIKQDECIEFGRCVYLQEWEDRCL